jgi:hypothetical protein
VKQYLKDGVALRIETVINAPVDLGEDSDRIRSPVPIESDR